MFMGSSKKDVRRRRAYGMAAVTLLVVVGVVAVWNNSATAKTQDVGLKAAAASVGSDLMKNCNQKCRFVPTAQKSICLRECKKTKASKNICRACVKDCKKDGGKHMKCRKICEKVKMCKKRKKAEEEEKQETDEEGGAEEPDFEEGEAADDGETTEAAGDVESEMDETGKDAAVPNPKEKDVGDIVGGSKTSSQCFPWIASMQVKSGGRWHHICGGSLISARSVLTAAHCCGYSAGSLRVVLGETHLGQNDPANEQHVGVEAVIRHPSYSKANSYYADVCVLTLKDNANTNNRRIGYATLAPRGTAPPPVGMLTTVIGWGRVRSGGASSQELLKVDVRVETDATCQAKYNGRYTIHSNQICASSAGRDACQGDSGGPLMRKSDNCVVGVVSYGIGCAHPNYPGVYQEVSHFRAWIDSKKTGPKKKSCVWSQSVVKARRGGEQNGVEEMKLEEVSIGDWVETTSGYEMVWFIEGKGSRQKMVEMKVWHGCGAFSGVEEAVESVRLTEDHLVLDGRTGELRRADEVSKGDVVKMHVGGSGCRGTVVEMADAEGEGMSIVTKSGTFVLANGVVVSSYSQSARYARVIHALSLPFRLLSSALNPKFGMAALEALGIPDAVRPGSAIASVLL